MAVILTCAFRKFSGEILQPLSCNEFWSGRQKNRFMKWAGMNVMSYREHWRTVGKALVGINCWRCGLRRPYSGRVKVTMTIGPRSARGRYDLDNCCKLPLDCLVLGGALTDDAQVDPLILKRGETGSGVSVVVETVED